MAIAGSPGIPSRQIYIKNRRLHNYGITVNRPASIVTTDVEAACGLLLTGAVVTLAVNEQQYPQVRKWLVEKGAIDG